MKSPSTANPRISDRVCFVCGCPAIGRGYAPPKIRSVDQVAWLCGDPECVEIAEKTYTMRQQEFTRLDTLAAEDGGAEGGQYLDSLGKGNAPLAELSAEEWQEFLKRVVGGYRAALKGRLRNEAPF